MVWLRDGEKKFKHIIIRFDTIHEREKIAVFTYRSPHFVSPGDAPATITQYVAWVERQSNACQTPRSMYLSIFNSFRVIRCLSQCVSPTRSPATAGIANRPLLFLEHRIPMPELFTVRRFTRVLEAGKYGCPY